MKRRKFKIYQISVKPLLAPFPVAKFNVFASDVLDKMYDTSDQKDNVPAYHQKWQSSAFTGHVNVSSQEISPLKWMRKIPSTMLVYTKCRGELHGSQVHGETPQNLVKFASQGDRKG